MKSVTHSILLFFLFILYLSINPGCIKAQKSTGQVFLTMEEAVFRALEKNNKILSSKYALKKAEWDTKQAWTRLFPTLSFNTRYTWIDEQTFAERDFRRYLPPDLANQFPQTVFQKSYYSSFDVSMPVFNGAVLNGLSIANKQEDMFRQLDKATREQIIFNVIGSYLNVLKNKELVNLQKEYLDLSGLNYEKAQRLFQANRYSQNEMLRWKVDYQQQKSAVVNSESALRSEILMLGRLINSNFNEDTKLEGKITDQLEEEIGKLIVMSEEELLGIINLSEDELKGLNSNLAAAWSNQEILGLLHRNSYTNYLPNISLSYSYGWRENGTLALDDYSPKTFMINLSVPIFSGFQNFTHLKSTLYEYKQSEEDFKDQVLNTKLLLNDVVNRIITQKTLIELSKTNVEYNKNNYRVVEQQKEKGLVSNIDFIDAKLSYQNAKINEITAHYDFITAVVQLYYLLGKLESLF